MAVRPGGGPRRAGNRFTDPAYRQTVRDLSRELLAYGKQHNDPSVADAKVQGDLKWAVEGTGAYVSTPPAKEPYERLNPKWLGPHFGFEPRCHFPAMPVS